MNKIALTGEGLVIYSPEQDTSIRLSRTETEVVQGRDINWDELDSHIENAYIEVNRDNKEIDDGIIEHIVDDLDKYCIFRAILTGKEPIESLRKTERLISLLKEHRITTYLETKGEYLFDLSEPYLLRLKKILVKYSQNMEMLFIARKNSIKTEIYFDYKDLSLLNDALFRARKFSSDMTIIPDKDSDIQDAIKVCNSINDRRINSVIGGYGCSITRTGICKQRNNFVYIGLDGEVYPCVYNRKSIGNIMKTALYDIWIKRGEQEECPIQLVKK